MGRGHTSPVERRERAFVLRARLARGYFTNETSSIQTSKAATTGTWN
jgi:hypothetical protein